MKEVLALEVHESELESQLDRVRDSLKTASCAKANLDAMADIQRGYVKTSPTSEFKVIAIQRADDGKLDVQYDDVAV